LLKLFSKKLLKYLYDDYIKKLNPQMVSLKKEFQ